MVHLAAVTEDAVLEFCGVLADIVGHACRISPRLGSERPREFSRHLGHLAKMVGHFFDTPIFGNMGYVHEYLPSVGAIARRSAIKYNSS